MVSGSSIPESESDSPDEDLQLHIYVRSLAPTFKFERSYSVLSLKMWVGPKA